MPSARSDHHRSTAEVAEAKRVANEASGVYPGLMSIRVNVVKASVALLHTVAVVAPITYCHSPYHIRLQPPAHTVTAPTYGGSLHHILYSYRRASRYYVERYGPSLCYHIRLQPLSLTVPASVTYGCSLCHLRLQPLSLTVADEHRPGRRAPAGATAPYPRRPGVLDRLLRPLQGRAGHGPGACALGPSPVTYGHSLGHVRLQPR